MKFQFLDQYRRIASGQDSPDQLSLRISLLKNITVFLDCDPSTLEQVALKTRITYYEQDSVILVSRILSALKNRKKGKFRRESFL